MGLGNGKPEALSPEQDRLDLLRIIVVQNQRIIELLEKPANKKLIEN